MLSFCQNEFIFIDSAHVFSFSSFSKVNLEQEHSLSLSLCLSPLLDKGEGETNKQTKPEMKKHMIESNQQHPFILLEKIYLPFFLFVVKEIDYSWFCCWIQKTKPNQTNRPNTHTQRHRIFFYGNILFRVPNKQQKKTEKKRRRTHGQPEYTSTFFFLSLSLGWLYKKVMI